METSDDPVSIMAVAAAAGTAGQVMAARQQGKNMQKIGEANALADEMNAKAARESAAVRASNMAASGRRLLARQTSAYAAKGVRVDSGAPVTVGEATRKALLADINYAHEQGEARATAFENSAKMQRAQGDYARTQSRYDMATAALSGGFNIGMLGYNAGWFSGSGGSGVPGSDVQTGSLYRGRGQAVTGIWEGVDNG